MTPETPVDPSRNLSKTEEWFRDTFYRVLSWGSALSVLIAGWTFGESDLFSLDCSSATQAGKNVCERTWMLTISFLVAILFWNILVFLLREKCPKNHATVPSKPFVYSYLIAMTYFSLQVLYLIVKD